MISNPRALIAATGPSRDSLGTDGHVSMHVAYLGTEYEIKLGRCIYHLFDCFCDIVTNDHYTIKKPEYCKSCGISWPRVTSAKWFSIQRFPCSPESGCLQKPPGVEPGEHIPAIRSVLLTYFNGAMDIANGLRLLIKAQDIQWQTFNGTSGASEVSTRQEKASAARWMRLYLATILLTNIKSYGFGQTPSATYIIYYRGNKHSK
ncbi:hypothetical protein BU17DRAFT_63651 [Hysterangium stoloniferum]|nr:hypothetical protein BU17DRAFT_63651 [Hysterangium stoloniferum]